MSSINSYRNGFDSIPVRLIIFLSSLWYTKSGVEFRYLTNNVNGVWETEYETEKFAEKNENSVYPVIGQK